MLLLSVLIGLQYSSSTASIVRPLSLMDGRRSSCGHHDVPAGLTEHAVATSKPSKIASADAFKSWLTSCDAPAADVHISVLMTNCQQYAEVSGIVNIGDLFTNTRGFSKRLHDAADADNRIVQNPLSKLWSIKPLRAQLLSAKGKSILETRTVKRLYAESSRLKVCIVHHNFVHLRKTIPPRLTHGSLLSCDGLLFQAVLAENEDRDSKEACAASSAASSAAESAAEAPIATALRARVKTLSPQYKQAVREFQLVTGVSNNKTARAQLLIVVATLLEYSDQFGGTPPDIDKLIQIIPTNHASIVDDCHAFDEFLLIRKCKNAFDAAFANHDAGHAGHFKQTYSSICGYDHLRNCILEQSLGAERLAGGGKAIADCIIEQFTELGVPCCGQATDNASDVSATAAKFLSDHYLGFVAVGCSLHQLNLVLMNAYHSTFGFEEMGVCSPLRVAYIVNYLMSLEGHLELWVAWANTNGYEDIAFKACGSSKGRWWSVLKRAWSSAPRTGWRKRTRARPSGRSRPS
jgi:hypothetical protein